MKLPGPKKKSVTCPRCHKEVSPDTPFCESCGARIAPPPACSLCGTLLVPGSRFCASCGTMIGSSKDSPPPDLPDAPGAGAAPAKKLRASRAKKPKPADAEPQEKQPDPLMMIPDDEPEPVKEPEIPGRESLLKKTVPVTLASVTIPPPRDKSRFSLPGGMGKKGVAVAVVIVIIAIALLVLSGAVQIFPASSLPAGTAVTVTTLPTPEPVVPETTAVPDAVSTSVPVTTAEVVSFEPGPTDVPPDSLLVYFEVKRDPISKMVSVQYKGGKGQRGVREVFVRLTRSDGEVLTGTFRPLQVDSGIELQGTEKLDRVEVITRYYSGEEFKLVDQVFEYKIRT